MKILGKTLFALVLVMVGLALFKPATSLAYSPHSTESWVVNSWDNNFGYKYDNMYNGNNIQYDVYSNKYINGGYEIVNRDFGRGSQPYLRFTGYAVNFGYKAHTSSNHDTYIAAVKTSGSGVGTTYVYKTAHINISSTEEVEYNNKGPGSVWNECPPGSTNKDNYYDCNMRYDNVGFDAYLPLNELFPASDQNAGWTLYLVKRVDSHVVYTELKLPFTFANKDYNGGKIALSSGVNANSLVMTGTRIFRRTGPGTTYSSDGYFTTGKVYNRIDVSESGTTVWFGVDVGGGVKRWGGSAYWGFGGDRATLSYDAPPKHNSHSLTNYNYKNGNDYWTKPNDPVNVTLRQYDQTANMRNYIRIAGSGVDARAWHDLGNSSAYWFDHWDTDKNVEITGANRTEKTANYATVVWTVKPKTHGHTYDVQYYYMDTAYNSIGYNNTGMRLRVDGLNPTVSFRNSADTANFLNRDWSNTQIAVRLKFGDADSGYKQSRYQWSTSTSTPSSWSSWTTSSNYIPTKSGYGQWYLHVQAQDNVGNTVTTYSGPYKFNNVPVANFSWSPSTIYNNTNVSFNNSSTDADGNSLSHQWAYQSPGNTSWVNFSTVVNPSKVFNVKGTWKIRLTVSDGIATHSAIKSLTVQNRPPVAGFKFDRSLYYIGENMTISSLAYDLDGDPLTYKYEAVNPDGVKEIYTTESFSITPAIPGNYKVTQTVTDDSAASDTISATIFVNDLTINGHVKHTLDWEKLHAALGNAEGQFYSGETFMLEADITNYPVRELEVTMVAPLLDGSTHTTSTYLIQSTPILFSGSIDGQPYISEKRIKQGPAYFVFKVTYENGYVVQDIVEIEIIGSIYKALQLHRTH